MCGILGYYHIDHQPVERSRPEVEALRDMMRNRGPDASGYLEGARKDWVLAHRRLAIIDLSERGHQPMTTPDGNLHLSYNGEIYNFQTLRDDLAKRGVVFRSTSDTEVILHLYREYGTSCFKMLEGMFAIILVDEAKRCCVMARDPVGKKPLYYALLGRTLVMASDPGVISRDRDYRKEVSIDGLYSVLAMGGVRAPHSLFRGIYKLEPGSYIVADENFSAPATPSRYFEFALKPRSGLLDDEETAIRTLDHLLDRAVEKRMLSDVPFGVFLSGGIDSALIVHYMSRHTDRVNTISVDMSDSADSLREGAAALAVAKRYGTNHHSIDLNTAEYIRILDEVVLPNSTPGMTESVLLAKLSELLFVEAMRQYSVTFTDQDAGWLKGVADPQIGRALAAIHHNISSPWSADSLAREVSMSRSAFVDRFTTLIGMPPIRYLTIWRLQTAKLSLRETRKTIAQLAQEMGYGSGEAFSRAFKREFGLSPARWRDQQPVD